MQYHYNDDTVCFDILIFYEQLKEALNGVSPTGTLITKIMLGTVGCVPALDAVYPFIVMSNFLRT